MTAKPFSPVTDVQALDKLVDHSQSEPVILFKHDRTCPISAAAYRQMSQLPGDVALVDVNSARAVSQEIARRTGVRHESPQVIMLRNGEPVWSVSHHDITSEAVMQASDQYA